MGEIDLHVANANQEFTDDEVALFQNVTKAAEDFISQNFDFTHNVNLIFTEPSTLQYTIPEDGITARTYSSRLIIVVIDKHQAKIDEDKIFETICHEMSHSLRWESQKEYADTLFRGLILEGLAVVLEEKALADTHRKNKQFFLETVQETSTDEIRNILSQLSPDFDKTEYDYDTLFFTGDETLPRWAGYRLGYYLVKQHLVRTRMSIADATLARYDDLKPI